MLSSSSSSSSSSAAGAADLPRELWTQVAVILLKHKHGSLLEFQHTCRLFRELGRDLDPEGKKLKVEGLCRNEAKRYLRDEDDVWCSHSVSENWLVWNLGAVSAMDEGEKKEELKETLAMKAAYHGYGEVLKVMDKVGCPMNNAYLCSLAAQAGSQDALVWLRGSKACPWGRFTCAKAARGGHLHVLKWLRSEGCPWGVEVSCGAARGGHLDLIKWVRSQAWLFNEFTCAAAAEGGHLDVLQWLREQDCPWDEWTCNWAIKKGQALGHSQMRESEKRGLPVE